jgi:hypothetical protein
LSARYLRLSPAGSGEISVGANSVAFLIPVFLSRDCSLSRTTLCFAPVYATTPVESIVLIVVCVVDPRSRLRAALKSLLETFSLSSVGVFEMPRPKRTPGPTGILRATGFGFI